MEPSWMELIQSFGKDSLATVYVVKLREGDGHLVECVESLQPPRSRSEKWVLIISTLYGCPVGCLMCDAGGSYHGRLSAGEMMAQIKFLVQHRFNGTKVPVEKFKIQFARMGDPALNPAVLDLLEQLPQELDAPGLLPSVSSIAPAASVRFFERLLQIKNQLYSGGRFQLQFSIHSTDSEVRKKIIPVPTLDFHWMGTYGRRFRVPGDQQITLNFAASRAVPLDPIALLPYFDPEHFLIKITPLNPTLKAQQSGMRSRLEPSDPSQGEEIVKRFNDSGYKVILSLGEWEENAIGSNCGQYVTRVEENHARVRGGYDQLGIISQAESLPRKIVASYFLFILLTLFWRCICESLFRWLR